MKGQHCLIRIHKPTPPPAKLLRDGKNKRRSHSLAYTRDPKAYRTGGKKFDFEARIYNHPTVKQALIAAQFGKCCFCERIVGTDGDVEHFRPKQAYQQAPGDSLERPGYYWLAYEWDNLYLSCSACNQRHKQNLFPLQNPGDRAIDPSCPSSPRFLPQGLQGSLHQNLLRTPLRFPSLGLPLHIVAIGL